MERLSGKQRQLQACAGTPEFTSFCVLRARGRETTFAHAETAPSANAKLRDSEDALYRFTCAETDVAGRMPRD
jgi:hypothetical protein